MPAKKLTLGLGTTAVIATAALAWIASPTSDRANAPETVAGTPDTLAPSEDGAAAAASDSSEPAPTNPSPDTGTAEGELPGDMSKAEARRERRRLELIQAAETRFQEAVRMDGLEPADVTPAVRAMFRTVKLQPVVDPQTGSPGYVQGMRIAELGAENPLARAGFQAGDRLTRINGKPLTDPAQIAHLFTTLDQRFEVCAESTSGDRCRVVALSPER